MKLCGSAMQEDEAGSGFDTRSGTLLSYAHDSSHQRRHHVLLLLPGVWVGNQGKILPTHPQLAGGFIVYPLVQSSETGAGHFRDLVRFHS